MTASRRVTSAQNPLIKQVLQLRRSKNRQLSSLLLVDGSREIARAIAAGWHIETVFTLDTFPNADQRDAELTEILEALPDVDWLTLPRNLLEKIAYGESQHAVAIARTPTISLDRLSRELGATATVIVLDRVEKPGNIGAVLRTANAFGVSAVLLSDSLCDQWNPNVIRASTGAIFETPLVALSSDSVYEWLRDNQFHIFAARVEGSTNYAETSFAGRTALVFGNEAAGLEQRWQYPGVKNISIAMRGSVDSLNVSVTAAIIAAAVVDRQAR